jgi:hypothetical protein
MEQPKTDLEIIEDFSKHFCVVCKRKIMDNIIETKAWFGKRITWVMGSTVYLYQKEYYSLIYDFAKELELCLKEEVGKREEITLQICY